MPYIYKIVSKKTWNYNTGVGLETFSEIIMLFVLKQVSKDNYTNKGFLPGYEWRNGYSSLIPSQINYDKKGYYGNKITKYPFIPFTFPSSLLKTSIFIFVLSSLLPYSIRNLICLTYFIILVCLIPHDSRWIVKVKYSYVRIPLAPTISVFMKF